MADEWADTKSQVRAVLAERETQELLGFAVDEAELYVRVRQYEIEDGERHHVEDSLYAVHVEPDFPEESVPVGEDSHLQWVYLGPIQGTD